MLGDGVWEGLRVRAGHPAFLEQHLDRLHEGAKAILLDIGLSREALTDAIYDTLRANEMVDGVARAPDGHPRRQAHALPGPARHRSAPPPS